MDLHSDLHSDDALSAISVPLIDHIANSPDWFRDLVAHSQTLLCVHNLEGRLLSVNAAASQLLGYTEEEMLRKSMRDFLSLEEQPMFDLYLDEIKRTGESHGLLNLLTKSGKNLVWEYHNTLHTLKGSPPQIHGIALDVTARVQAEKTLLLANDKLVQLAQERQQLFSG